MLLKVKTTATTCKENYVTKRELADIIYRKMAVPSKRNALKTVDAIFDEIRFELQATGATTVHGLGVFKVLEKPPRNYYNPTLGRMTRLETRRVVKFYPNGKVKAVAKIADKVKRVRRKVTQSAQ